MPTRISLIQTISSVTTAMTAIAKRQRPWRAVCLLARGRSASPRKQMGVGAEREHQAEQIDRQQDDRHHDAEGDRLGDELAAADVANTEGTMMAIAASAIMPTWVRAPMVAKVWTGCFRPPARNAAPSTSSRLPMIEPVSEALTTSSMPARSATRAMISSAALPSVALRKPPIPSPTRAASFSVARPSRPASGMMATQASTNTSSGLSGRAWCSKSVTGTASSSHASGASARMLRIIFIAVPR